MGKKEDVIQEVFDKCVKDNEYIFNNDLVKKVCLKHGFKNPFDLTKIDNSKKLPKFLKDEDFFIVHLGKGFHRFVKGVDIGLHKFEDIPAERYFPWKYRKSILNEYDTSESNILSVVTNQRIIHDFLYNDIVANPRVYLSRRTQIDMEYYIDKIPIKAYNQQMEIDLTYEYNSNVTVFEGKNNFPNDFAVFQLFNPNYYFNIQKKTNNLPINEITCCYVLRKKFRGTSLVRIYLYKFLDYKQMNSIKLIKNAQYELIVR
ncbi:hypothetical protein ISS30_09995 [bacterium]|nr:hypothetical protein [FCB group bacterium]MBL7192016.1 hypothetical protein [bacterium]